MTVPLSNDPDQALIEACQASRAHGLEGAFREMYELYRDRVYNVCYRVTGNGTDALDASQETFGILFRKIAGFRFESRFSSWVYRIAVNTSIDLKRRSNARSTASLEALQASQESRGNRLELPDEAIEAPADAASRHELEEEVQQAILRLSPKMRVITVLRYVQGLSYEQIGEALEVSLGTVKSRLYRAHAALDRELTPVIDKHFLG